MDTKRKVAVIGAGVSGLVSIKACKEEGLDVVCYEITDDIGGLWKFREENISFVSCVHKMTVMNISREMTAFSDFPPPSDFPIYIPRHLAHKYLCLYAEKYSLVPHIRFGRRVTLVEEAGDYETTGRWKVTARVNDMEVEEEEIYDAVMVCTGSYNKPFVPSILGQECFKGSVSHSYDYKDSSRFKGRKVLIVGSGNSSCDVAVELCNVADSVYISSRNGARLWPRTAARGEPFDASIFKRLYLSVFHNLPMFITNKFMNYTFRQYFDTSLFNLTPSKTCFESFATANDLLPFYILSGGIKVRGRIKLFTFDGVVFEGEDNTTPIDDVIFGTGYEVTFPFLKDYRDPIDFYKFIIPTNLEHSTLAFIGFVENFYPFFPTFEMQARWYIQVLTGKVKLPSRREMQERVINDRKARISRLGVHRKYLIFEPYLDQLANEIGAMPSLLSMLIRDPVLFYHYLMGPLLSYQYRLVGPHSWSQARKALLTYRQRLFNI